MLAAPEAWMRWEANQLSACRICRHGSGPAAARVCTFGLADSPCRRPVPVVVARRLGGHCGPEAEQLDFPGLRA